MRYGCGGFFAIDLHHRLIAKMEGQAIFGFWLESKQSLRGSLTGMLLLPEMLGVGTAGK